MGSNDAVAFVLIIIFAVIYVCYKICCHLYFDDETDEETAGQAALNTQDQQPARPYVITTRLTGHQPTQTNLPFPPKSTGPPYVPQLPSAPERESYLSIPQIPSAPQPDRNLSGELDLPPSFEEAMKQITHQKPHN